MYISVVSTSEPDVVDGLLEVVFKGVHGIEHNAVFDARLKLSKALNDLWPIRLVDEPGYIAISVLEARPMQRGIGTNALYECSRGAES